MAALAIGRVRALVFDIDGTLYRQDRLRRAVLLRLFSAYGLEPTLGYKTVRVLQAYRRAQESLRQTHATGIAAAQIGIACERTHANRDFVEGCVSRWMEQEPLAFLPRCIQPGILELLQSCKARGIRLGALSDYPAQAKLETLGLSGLFDVVVFAQDPAVDVFKPDPRGLLMALKQLGTSPDESLYIGDRVDVDAATAEAAGVRCAILTSRRSSRIEGAHIEITSFAELREMLGQ